MFRHESESLGEAAELLMSDGESRETFSQAELRQVAQAIHRVRESIDRILSEGPYPIDDWNFCLYLADSGPIDELLCTIDKTGVAWRRHVEKIRENSRLFLQRLKDPKPQMTLEERREIAGALDEAMMALSSSHYADDESDEE